MPLLNRSSRGFGKNTNTQATDVEAKHVTSLISGQTSKQSWITDASERATVVSTTGNVRPSKFTPYNAGYYSNYFDGTGDYLTTPASAAFDFHGDWTFECWVYPTAITGYHTFLSQWGGTNNIFIWKMNSSGRMYLENLSTAITATSTTIVVNKWQHIALTRSSDTIRMFVNGVVDATTASRSGVYYTSTDAMYVGSSQVAEPYTGYISNMRVLNGTALYTTTFTPPTTPLTAITTASSYNSLGSAYFDGTGDYFTLPSNQIQFTMGTGDFTIECWVYITSLASNRTLYDTMNASDGTGTGRFAIQVSTLGVLEVFTTTGTILTSGGTVVINQWHHIAYSRASASGRLYVNGVQVNTTYNDTNNYVVGTTSRPIIGINGYDNSTNPMLGYISDLRIVKSIALYTTSFFTPNTTTPLTAISGTSLLTCQNALIDNSTNAFTITRAGQARPVAVSPYTAITTTSLLTCQSNKLIDNSLNDSYNAGYYSNYFDGTGDWLTAPASTAWNFTGDWTFECWVYPTAITGYHTFLGQWGAPDNVFIWKMNSSGRMYLENLGLAITATSTTIVVNQWQHIALTRNSNTIRMFVNGVLDATTATRTFTYYSSGAMYVGASGVNEEFKGYISNMRVLNGTALYVSNFTPPTTPLTAITNTSLLTCQSTTLIDNSTANAGAGFTITKNGDTFVSHSHPFTRTITKNGDTLVSHLYPFTPPANNYGSIRSAGGGSGVDVVTFYQGAWFLSSTQFTIEAWLYFPVSLPSNQIAVIGQQTNGICFYVNASGNWEVNHFGTGTVVTSAIPLVIGQWTHVAITRNSSNLITLWVNGDRAGTATASTEYTAGTFTIGRNPEAYVADLRILTATALYAAPFPPPVLPVRATSTTEVLLGQSYLPSNNHTMFDGSSRGEDINKNGNASAGTYNPFGDNWSTYFGGVDFISHPHTENYNLYNYDAFIDFWINPTQNDTNFRGIVCHANNSGSWTGWQVYISSGKINVETNVGATTGIRLVSSIEVQTGKWTYIRISKTFEIWTIYQDGVNVGSTRDTAGNYNSTDPLLIGLSRSLGSTDYFIGYISNLRVVRGHSVFDNLPFASPFTKFNGTTDYLSSPNNAAFALGAGDFTVECWCYTTTIIAAQSHIFDTRTTASPGSTNPNLYLTNATMQWLINGSNLVTGTIGLNTWTHVAVVRTSGTTTMYINGSRASSVADSVTYTSAQFQIGKAWDANYWNGYISNFRMVQGFAVYTAEFEPQRRPLAATQIAKDTRQYPGGSYSVALDGASNYLSFANNTALDLATGAPNWTIECWFYLNVATGAINYGIFQKDGTSGSVQPQYSLAIMTNGTFQGVLSPAVNSGGNQNFDSTVTVTSFVWNHVAMVRNGSFISIFLNGRRVVGPTAMTITMGTNNGVLTIGGTPTGLNNLFPGYISNFRIVKGKALYTNNFTVPSSAFFSIPDTSILACQSSTLIDAGPNAIAVTLVGTPTVSNKFPYVFGDVVPALSSGTSLLTVQNSTIVDNSGNGLAITATGTPISSNIPIPLETIPSSASVPIISGIPSANVVFLSAKANRIKDSSIYNNSNVSITGSPKVAKFSPFPSTITVPISYSYKFENISGTVRAKILPIDSPYQYPRLNSWTAEWWMNRTGKGGSGGVHLLGKPYSSTGSPAIQLNDTSITITNSGIGDIVTFTVPSSINFNNNWNHVAVVKSTETTVPNPRYTLFVNGANIGSHVSTEYDYANSFICIGSDSTAVLGYDGYLSNFRITRSALYDYTQANVTIPKGPLQLTGDTLILTCQSPTLEIKTDYPYLGNTGYSTFVGDRLYATENNPFGYTTINNKASYDANAFGGSIYFDGLGDYLAVNEFSSQRLSDIFTIQGWFNATSKIAANIAIVSKGAVATGWQVMIGTGNTLIFSNATTAIQSTSTIKYNEWNHFAVTRDNGWNTRLFLNGNLETSATIVNPYTETSNIYIGSGRVAGANVFTGYIAGLQIDKHVAYANSFIPPYFAQRPTANTVFYLESIPAVIDYSGRTNFETTGNNMVRPLVLNLPNLVAFTNSEFFRQSNGDFLSVADNAALQFSTTDFTVECWIYAVSVGSRQNGIVSKGTNTTGWELRIGGAVSGGLDFSYTSTGVTNATVVSQNTWHHVALTRSGTSIKSFLDGVNVGTGTSSDNLNQTDALKIGDGRQGAQTFDGYISNLRIVKGTALYTAAFPAPTVPVSFVTSTSLLTCQSSTLIDNSGNGLTPTIGAGSPTISTFSPFPTYTYAGNLFYNPISFDGSSALKSPIATQHLVTAAGSPFTFEASIYPVTDNNTHYLLALGPEAGNRYNVALVNGYLTTNRFGAAASTNVGYPKIQPNVWTNIAVVRTNYPTGLANIVSFYINGVVANTTDVMFSSNNQLGNGLVYIGADGSGANQFKGYMKDIRITNGIARYTANAAVPSAILIPKTYNGITPIQPVPNANVDYLLVAGGGGGGQNAGSGAGAGGVVLGKFQYAPGLLYTITLGGGGTTGTSDPVSGTMGGNSSMFGFTVYGGGGGGSGVSNGLFGGSGGGMPSQAPGKLTAAPGVGWPAIQGINQQGSPGAANPSGLSASNRTTGGGGGAGAIGTAPQVGVGGYGILSSISGANLYYAGGGGGGHHTTNPGGAGGAGGGGNGGPAPGGTGFSGTVNTGGGGGGGAGPGGLGGAGGSGIAIIRHPTAIATAYTTGSNVLVTVGTSNVVYQFYSSGTIQFQ